MADIFGQSAFNVESPITTSTASIVWNGTLLGTASNVSVGASRSVSIRHTIGNKSAIIQPGNTVGSISISRLVVAGNQDIFSLPGWSPCTFATITVTFADCDGNSVSLTVSGCSVVAYSLSADAESMTVVDQIQIQFLQLSAS